MTKNKNKVLFLFLLPAAIFTFIFSYLPMTGLWMAFNDYNIYESNFGPYVSIFTSDFVGFANFKEIFTDPYFWNVFQNTITISALKVIFLFPLPIIAAILINEILWDKLKRVIQTILYLPHFLSWVIVAGIWYSFLGNAGLVNTKLIELGIISEPIEFLVNSTLFVPVLLITDAWKEIGWSAIIYLAAISSIDYQLYEAIKIDGGSKWQEIRYITIPGISNTIVMMLILRIATVMDAGFDQIFNMYSVYVYDVADIIGTYTYRIGLGQMEYSMATAVGLFNSVIAFTLVLIANKLARKLTGKGIW